MEGLDARGLLDEGTTAFERNEWSNALSALVALDQQGELGADGLGKLSVTKYMLGDVGGMIDALERAHHAFLAEGNVLGGVRSAVWLGGGYASRGKLAQASGWLDRAQRLLEPVEEDCVERGYVLYAEMLRYRLSGEIATLIETAEQAIAIGRRFKDPDLVAMVGHEQADAMLHSGMSEEGLRILDEVMVSVTAGEVAPPANGIVYCGVVASCFETHELKRAAEWTAALTAWCATQPDLVAFTGQCLAHRAEILRWQGDWDGALIEADRAKADGVHGPVGAQAVYQQAEIHRHRGELDKSEAAYRDVGLEGVDPQPGLALLRVAQGNLDAAGSSMRRALAEPRDLPSRAILLAGQIEVMIDTGDLLAAGEAADELTALADKTGIDMHRAWAASGRGMVELARSNHDRALIDLREAMRLWSELGVPYETARARLGLALALIALGDSETADIELEAARSAFSTLGAEPDVRHVDTLRAGDREKPHGLTRRELEVLSLLSSGASNRAIAGELVLSERTVDRHVSNIFAKLGVSSRSAATAFAIRNQLV